MVGVGATIVLVLIFCDIEGVVGSIAGDDVAESHKMEFSAPPGVFPSTGDCGTEPGWETGG